MPHKHPLNEERKFKVCEGKVTIETTVEDFFGAIMHDISRPMAKRMILIILNEYNLDRAFVDYIMGKIEEVV